MSNTTTNDDDLRRLANRIERRRSRIARTQSSLSVLVGAYDLVAADLRAASSERDAAVNEEAATAV